MKKQEYRRYPSTILDTARVRIGGVAMQSLFMRYDVPEGSSGIMNRNEAVQITDYTVQRAPATKAKAVLDATISLTKDTKPTTCYRREDRSAFTAYTVDRTPRKFVTTNIYVPQIFADEHFSALHEYTRETYGIPLTIADEDLSQRTITFSQNREVFHASSNLLLRELVCAANGLLILDENMR